jgi:hypothetical protein
MTQLVLYETKIVDMPQIFLPFATEAKGQTLYEKMVKGKFLLGPRPEERKSADQARGACLVLYGTSQ